MGKKTTQEHYVPQRYLKLFASDVEKTKIEVFDKVKNEIRSNQPIDRVACEGGFYDINLDNIFKRNNVENPLVNDFLQKIESNFTDTYLTDFVEPLFSFIDDVVNQFLSGKLVTNQSYVTLLKNKQIKNKISYYITYQYLRTRWFRDYFLNLIYQNGKDLNTLFDGRSSDIDKLIHLNIILDYQEVQIIKNTIESGIWILGYIKGSKVFYTSDNPICVIPNVDEKPSVFSDVILATYPILPNLILMVMSPKIAKRFGFELLNNKIKEIKQDAIDYFNNQRVSGAYRTVTRDEHRHVPIY